MKYNAQCSRCAGSGRFDRGTCFRCKGARFEVVARRPNFEPVNVLVEYANGKNVRVPMFFSSKKDAIAAVELELARKGWKGKVTA